MGERLFKVLCRCADCGSVLNDANHVPPQNYMQIILSAPLVTRACPKGCRTTYSDCNANTTLDWLEEVGDDFIPVSAEYVCAVARDPNLPRAAIAKAKGGAS